MISTPGMRATAASLIALGSCFPVAATAQSIAYGDVAAAPGEAASGGVDGQSMNSGRSQRGPGGARGGRRAVIIPYAELNQIVDAQLSPGDDILTYTQVAVGADASLSGRNNAVSASVRYAHHFGWGKQAGDGDTISGLVNGYATVARGLTIEGGALATRASGDAGGRTFGGGSVGEGTSTVYSAYAGPSFATRAGDVAVSANYRAGYTKVDQEIGAVAPGVGSVDVFDESVVQLADVSAAVAPGVAAPVGVGVAASVYQEDVSNLDQRVRDMQVRAIVTLPVNRTVQVTGAVGYENVELSSRDALRDANGAPIVAGNGRYVTDESSPRQIAYDVDGLIWDVGVMWRPSRRTSLAAHVGRRYGSTSFGGTFAYAPNDRSTLSITVYDNVAGFGGQITRLLDDLPEDFEAVRDPITGELRGCVSSLSGNGCLAGALGSVRSATFRARGVAANYTLQLNTLSAGLGAGYDRRNFLAARNTVLASANGVVDENYWLTAFLGGRLDQQSGWAANGYAQWLSSEDLLFDDVTAIGASASYYRILTARLRATAALGIDGLLQDEPLVDIWNASALLGVRYSF
ncbi:preprotein translocase subunit YajC [Novosphingobium sp. M1R2S20]|uniref:Preprotein translocase subunit YajC n=1 Tax=Novosphingobium rhizovicinum TaxID=3228928 RepID=A0ABV3RHF1_9SPHN